MAKNDLREMILDYFSVSHLKKQGIFHHGIHDEIIYHLNKSNSKINNTQIWGLLMFTVVFKVFR